MPCLTYLHAISSNPCGGSSQPSAVQVPWPEAELAPYPAQVVAAMMRRVNEASAPYQMVGHIGERGPTPNDCDACPAASPPSLRKCLHAGDLLLFPPAGFVVETNPAAGAPDALRHLEVPQPSAFSSIGCGTVIRTVILVPGVVPGL